MDIHKPKPIHNWRDFLKEVGTIVLGVCIALAAEQTVEWLHWKNRIRDATEAMRIELRDDDGLQAYARMAMVDCYAQKLDDLQASVEAVRPRAEIASLVADYFPPSPTWDAHAWNVVLSSDVGSHVPPGQMLKWAGSYAFVPALAERNARERENRTGLQLTRRQGDHLAESESTALLVTIAKLREDNIGMSGFSGALLRHMRDAGITLGKEQQEFILRGLRAKFHDCVKVPSLSLPTGTNRRFPSLSPPG